MVSLCPAAAFLPSNYLTGWASVVMLTQVVGCTCVYNVDVCEYACAAAAVWLGVPSCRMPASLEGAYRALLPERWAFHIALTMLSPLLSRGSRAICLSLTLDLPGPCIHSSLAYIVGWQPNLLTYPARSLYAHN